MQSSINTAAMQQQQCKTRSFTLFVVGGFCAKNRLNFLGLPRSAGFGNRAFRKDT
jgi:hypothetical protein